MVRIAPVTVNINRLFREVPVDPVYPAARERSILT